MSGLDIEITEKKSGEIIDILELYPRGQLEIKYERVFWCSDNTEPRVSRDNPEEPSRNRGPSALREPKISERLGAMSDVLGSMMGPPTRQQPRTQERRR